MNQKKNLFYGKKNIFRNIYMIFRKNVNLNPASAAAVEFTWCGSCFSSFMCFGLCFFLKWNVWNKMNYNKNTKIIQVPSSLCIWIWCSFTKKLCVSVKLTLRGFSFIAIGGIFRKNSSLHLTHDRHRDKRIKRLLGYDRQTDRQTQTWDQCCKPRMCFR